MTAKTTAIEPMSFEAALTELESLVKGLETGNTALEDSIAAYERGTALKAHCERKLREAQSKIETITVAADGSVTTKPFQGQE